MAIKKIDYQSLPVYAQRERILESLRTNQVIVVQSPTGSGKTTQIPVILYEAGYAENGIIAVTQPRRIAALSVSEFISNQLGTTYPGLVGYKMRFEDKTDSSTKIKIMTDGILLQELKLDPWLLKYSVIMVDEAHERSLNIDFVLGLLKRILKERKDFKVIISSATINAQIFSEYFGDCPIVTIDTQTFPVTMVYDPPAAEITTTTETGCEALLTKIDGIVGRVLDNDDKGAILIFLPGEKIIKDCMNRLDYGSYSRKIYTLPLYGRLPKEEQEKVFDPAPRGKKKIIISTNIAETSVTISDVTTVIDTGLAKLNFYNPYTFTSSLEETPVSKASCDQRRGRAGRTAPGTCYRLYPRKDYDLRQMYTTEEIYRTDLSEVVLRMAELGITQFYDFDFISPPGKEGIRGAIETLKMLDALNDDNTLSETGRLMVLFPLEPRVSRIIVEAIMRYPDVIAEAIVAASFLSANSPFVLPPGEEMEARRAHHKFNDVQGDFVSYLTIFSDYNKAANKEHFCKRNFLDERVMAEIQNIDVQLSEIVSNTNIPLGSGGSRNDYLCCVASGMIQFVCIREGRENYRSLTTDHICIHPGSNMFKTDPLYIVAGEIVRTSRMFAMSVSPLTKNLLEQINPNLEAQFTGKSPKKQKVKEAKQSQSSTQAKQATRALSQASTQVKYSSKNSIDDNTIVIGDVLFEVTKVKNKKCALLPIDKLKLAIKNLQKSKSQEFDLPENIRGKIIYPHKYTLLDGEKLFTILRIAKTLSLEPIPRDSIERDNISLHNTDDRANDTTATNDISSATGISTANAASATNETNSASDTTAANTACEKIIKAISTAMRVTTAKQKSLEYGFVCLFTDGRGNYWLKVSRGFVTALNETLSSLETLTDDENAMQMFSPQQREKINAVYRMIHELYE